MRLDQVVVRREAILDLEHDSVHVEGLDPGFTESSMAADSGRRQLRFRKTCVHEFSTLANALEMLCACVGKALNGAATSRRGRNPLSAAY